MKYAAIAAAIAVAFGVTACGTTTSSAPVANDDSSAVTYEDLINANSTAAQAFCDSYDSLVGQGWNNDTIYDEMKAGGAFDQGEGRDYYDALVKWCYNN